MLRIAAAVAILTLAACGAKEEPMPETPATTDTTAMKMDSSAAMDSTTKMADTTMKKM